ncbi:MAG TPA: peptidylprolyl isomerase [Candidatus Acidoferrales bacterium]|nr:peptidylprolyl isomerase [Candidatus Acidoferrales bacterium]
MRAVRCILLLFVAIGALAATTPQSVPTASAPQNSPAGAIGILERNRSTDPAALTQYVNSKDPAVQARALLAIGRLRNLAGDQILLSVLADTRRTDDVRAVAAFALGLIGSPSSVDALTGAARTDSPAIAAMAANALGRIGGLAAIDGLWPLLNNADADVRGQAAVSLGEAGLNGAPAIDFAHRKIAGDSLAANVFIERDPEVRWREAWALARGYYANEAPALRRLLTDDGELERMYGVAGLGRLHDRSYALPVRLLANDPSWRVRVAVRDALALLRDPTKVDVKPPAIPAYDLAAPQPVASSAPFGPHPQVAIVTGKGTIVLELFPDEAPYSVDNFLTLVDRGFYNGLTYFRVIQNFVVQGGDPKNTGDGDPGYSIPAELNPVEQLTGIISYGLNYDPKADVPLLDSAGSQYYITQSPQLHLDRGFTVFGRVVRGMAVVDAISPQPSSETIDVAKSVYRCEPVTQQTEDVENKLRTAEIGYDAQ